MAQDPSQGPVQSAIQAPSAGDPLRVAQSAVQSLYCGDRASQAMGIGSSSIHAVCV